MPSQTTANLVSSIPDLLASWQSDACTGHQMNRLLEGPINLEKRRYKLCCLLRNDKSQGYFVQRIWLTYVCSAQVTEDLSPGAAVSRRWHRTLDEIESRSVHRASSSTTDLTLPTGLWMIPRSYNPPHAPQSNDIQARQAPHICPGRSVNNIKARTASSTRWVSIFCSPIRSSPQCCRRSHILTLCSTAPAISGAQFDAGRSRERLSVQAGDKGACLRRIDRLPPLRSSLVRGHHRFRTHRKRSAARTLINQRAVLHRLVELN